MKRVVPARGFWLLAVSLVLAGGGARAEVRDQVGATLLQAMDSSLDGSGIAVLQPEVGEMTATNWQVNPSVLGQASAALTYSASTGSTNRFPNALGASSGHAGGVAGIFHSIAAGAPRVDNCEAIYFYSQIVTFSATNFADSLANQSFTFGNVTAVAQTNIDWNYDNYASQFNTLFVSAANNSGAVSPPATSYNGLGVGAYGGSSSVGPTIDCGRAKPDLTAPGSATSFSTPLVTGAAALLRQAGLRGDGGSDTNAAVDMRVIKALLLNGAIKPADWTNQVPSPLDPRYGAGVLNVFNAYRQLAAGKQVCSALTFSGTNSPHGPAGGRNALGVFSGWDFNTNSSVVASNGVNHYYFNLTHGVPGADFTATATLVWNRHLRKQGINNLDLFLYDAGSGALVACSTSRVDNVEHIYLPRLAPGSYDLQVVKLGGPMISATEPYALAFEFFSTPLSVAVSAGGTVLTWPVYPDGFTLQAAAGLESPRVWTALTNFTPVVTNGQNCVVLPLGEGMQIYRLSRQ